MTYPSSELFFAIVATQIAAVLMCSQGWLVPSLPWSVIGFVWGYNLVWMIVQD
jgi:H+-transporting ATPase